MVVAACTLGMYHHELYMNKSEHRVPAESGYQWVTRTLDHRTQYYRMFRMRKECFDKLHSVLQSSYGLKSTCKMTSIKALGIFLWMCASQQSVRQADNRFTRSLCIVSRKFDKVWLVCAN